MAFNDETKTIFRSAPVATPLLYTLPLCIRKSINYVTASAMKITDVNVYYEHICDMQDNISCPLESSLRFISLHPSRSLGIVTAIDVQSSVTRVGCGL